MDIAINSKVLCIDGECGHVTCVLINPVNRKITHLIVKERGIVGQERMVPIELVEDSLPKKIDLRIDKAGFQALENFISIKYVSGKDPFDAYLPEHYYLHPFVMPDYDLGYDQSALYTQEENIPDDELAVNRGAGVYAKDGQVGNVDEFLVSPITEKITHIVLREGHIWDRKQITIPVSDIERIDVEGVHLKLTKDDVNELPAIPIKVW